MDFTRYFDKNPLYGHTLGPSGSGVLQPQPFTTEWIGWLQPTTGVSYQKLSAYGVSTPSFVQESADAKYFGITFDSGSNLYYAFSSETSVSVTKVVSGSKTTYSFSGKSPILFNNSVLQISGNETTCFYTKEDNVIYFRNQSENFATQHVFFSGEDIRVLKAVVKNPLTGQLYRYGIFGLDSNANGLLWYSDRFPPFNQEFFQPFTQEPSGQVSTLSLWDIEDPVTLFLDGYSFASDDISVSPTGTINSLDGNNNMIGGHFI